MSTYAAKMTSDVRTLPWRILLVTLFASTLSNMDQSMFGYAVPGVMRDLNLDLGAIGLMISASFACAIFSAPAIASLVPRLGAPVVLTLVVAASAMFVGLQAVASTPGAFSVARILGFGISAAVIPVSSAYLASNSPPRGRAMLIAVQQCGYPLGWFIASLIAAPLMEAHGWRSPFWVAFGVIPLAALVYLALPQRAGDGASLGGSESLAGNGQLPSSTERSATQRPALLLISPAWLRLTLTFGAAFILYGGAIGGTSFYLPTFFQQARGYDAVTATRIVGLSYGVGMLGYIGAAFVSEAWLSRTATVVVWLFMATIGLLATIWLPSSVSQDMLTFGTTTIFFYGASSIMLTALLERFPAPLRPAAAALAGTASISLGFVIFPIVTAAAVAHLGWPMSFTLVIVPAVLISGLLMSSLPKLPQA